MPVLATITKPNRVSWIGATKNMIAQRMPMIALKRVKTLARTISLRERLLRTGMSLTSPRERRSATSAALRPGSRTGRAARSTPVAEGASPDRGGSGPSESVIARCVMVSTVRPVVGLHLASG